VCDDRETSKAVGERERESSFVGTRIRAAGASVHAFGMRSGAEHSASNANGCPGKLAPDMNCIKSSRKV
jgi:hypothetical protein